MFDTGSSTGEIIGHSKVLLLAARSGHVDDNYIPPPCRSLMQSRSDINGRSAQRQLATTI